MTDELVMEDEVSALARYWRHDKELKIALEEFESYIKSFSLVTKEYQPDEGEDPNDYVLKGKTYETYESPDEKWSYNPEPCFNDFNVEYGDEITGFGVRSDDDFFVEARLPYKFEEIPIEIIVKTLWPNIEKPKYNMGSHWYHGQQYIKLCDILGTEKIHQIISEHENKNE